MHVAPADPAQADLPDLEAAFAAGIAGFAAAAAAGTVDSDVSVLDRRLRIRCAGPTLVAPLVDAFRQRRIAAAGDADLTILAWDSPPEAWMRPVMAAARAAPAATFVTGAIAALIRNQPVIGIQAIDLRRRLALHWIARDQPVPAWERCRPFLPIIQWWLADGPWQLVHAAAVARAGGGILLAGPGGSGKSSVALACLRAGWRYAGDDFVPLASAPAPRVEALYGSARLRPDMAPHFPELAGLRIPPDAIGDPAKHDFLLSSALSQAAFAGFPVRAIVLPQVVGGRASAMHRAARGAALRALAPTTLGMLKGDAARAFDKIATFASAVPCFRLALGTDIDAIPGAIERAIDLAAP